MKKPQIKCQNTNILKAIKSKYILKKILGNLEKIKLMSLIQYNKLCQRIMDIKTKDYQKEYYKIELEIIPSENKFGKFINVNDNHRRYFNFYFNGKKESIKSNKFTPSDHVKFIIIKTSYKLKYFNTLFSNVKCIKKIKFIRFHRRDFKDLSNMFANCLSLEEINFNNKFNTSFSINLSHMFDKCSSLKILNLSNLKVNNVINMSHMFNGCTSLKEINLSNLDARNVINMSHMFNGCSSLKEIILSNFQTYKVVNLSNMFSGCSSLIHLNLYALVTIHVENMFQMFKGCISLKELDLSNFKTSNLIMMNEMFSQCYSLEKLDLSKFNTENIKIINLRLKKMNFIFVNTDNVDYIKSLIKSDFSILKLDFSNFNIKDIVGLRKVFNDCFSLVQLKCDDDLIKKEFSNYLRIKILIKGILFINHYKIFNLLKKI